MHKVSSARYERAIKRHLERVENVLPHLPEMIATLEKFANGENVPLPMVYMAMRHTLALLTLPVIPNLAGNYTPRNFWKKEPIGRLIKRCQARLKNRKK